MSLFTLGSTFEGGYRIIASLLDIVIIWFVIYYSLRVIRTNTRTAQIFKGIFFVILIDILAKVLGLQTIQFITDMFINWGFLAIIIIFQPEIRSLLEKLGKSSFFSRFSTMSNDDKSQLVESIVTASTLLSNDQTGALITLAQSSNLENYINTGTRLEAKVSAELLTSIFVTSTPLHDGAVIIQGDRVVCASAYFPPTNRVVSSRYGSRHRAAMGISEVTDAITIVISEETGSISVTREGDIETVGPDRLREILREVIFVNENSNANPSKPKREKGPSLVDKLVLKDQSVKTGPVEVEQIQEGEQTLSETTKLKNLHHKADQVAQSAGMKLPHKKARTTGSYPKKPKLTPEQVEELRNQALRELQRDKVVRPEESRLIDPSKVVGYTKEIEDAVKMVESSEIKKGVDDHE